jgi:signal transduction histidine kinase
MKTSIKSQLIKAFLAGIAVLFFAGASIAIIHFVLIGTYRSVSNKLVMEYSLADTISNLILDYNVFFKSPIAENRHKYDINVKKIISFYESLDELIVDKQSRADYEGLKNSIQEVLNETDAGIQSILSNDISGVSAHFDEANRKYLFVKDNVSTLILDELKDAERSQEKIKTIYLVSSVGIVLMMIFTITGVIIFAVVFSKKITSPLIRLSEVSGKIAKGQLNLDVDSDLIQENNETGVLAKAFNEMLIGLRTNIYNLSQANSDLETKNQELDRLNKLLEGLKLKTEFLQVINHQLRTPISAMRGYLEFWRTGKYVNFTPDKQKEMQDNIIIASDQLADIINNMVDALELEMGDEKVELNLKDIDLKNLIKEIYEVDFKQRFETKNLSFELKAEKNSVIQSDKGFLSNVISNLLDNSLKYTPRGKVTVRLDHENDYAIISVEDTGIGLTESDKATLFGKFTRGAEAISMAPGGSGLGLFIVNKIIGLLRGEIIVASEGRNKGSIFTIKIPNKYSNENN